MSKSFASALADYQVEPIRFDLGADAEFEVQRPIPGFAVARLAARGTEDGARAIAAFLEFLEAVMDSEQFERFSQAAIEKRIDLETLIAIGTYIMEEGTGRPTQESSDSSPS